MSVPLTSKKNANTVCLGVFIGGVMILAYLGRWWPQIFLAIGSAILIRQFLRGRRYDLLVSSGIFGGLFFTYFIPVNWAFMVPVILVTAALTILFREFFVDKERFAEEQREDVHQEIEEDREHPAE